MMSYKETLFFIGKCLTISHEKQNLELVEQEIKSGNVDWDNVVKRSTQHYVFPALYCNLKRANLLSFLPEELVDYMKDITDLNRERNVQIIEQAKEINELLLANNITPVFLKGTGNLLEELYEDIAERMVGDIDFLVAEDDFEKTVMLLKKDNYTKTSKKLSSPIITKHYPRLFKQNKIAAVEIHKEMVRKNISTYFNFQSIINSVFSIKKYTFLSYENQLTLTILTSQFNDYGYYYKTLNFRNAYDAYLLFKYTKKLPNNIKKHQKLFHILNTFLAATALFFNSNSISYKENFKTTVFKKVLITKLDYSFFRKLHRNLLKFSLFLYLKFRGLLRFLFNKEFRKYYLKKISIR